MAAVALNTETQTRSGTNGKPKKITQAENITEGRLVFPSRSKILLHVLDVLFLGARLSAVCGSLTVNYPNLSKQKNRLRGY